MWISLYLILLLLLPFVVSTPSPVLEIMVLGVSDNFQSTNPWFASTVEAYSNAPPSQAYDYFIYTAVDMMVADYNALGGFPLNDGHGTLVTISSRILNLHSGLSDAQRFAEESTFSAQIANGTFGNVNNVIQFGAEYPELFADACSKSGSCAVFYASPPRNSDFECNSISSNATDGSCVGKRTGYKRYSTLFSCVPNFDGIYTQAISIWRQNGASKIGLISSDMEIDQTIAAQTRSLIQDNKLDLIFDLPLYSADAAQSADFFDNWIAQFQAADLDVLLWVSIDQYESASMLENFLLFSQRMQSNQYLPRAFSPFTTWVTAPYMTPDMLPGTDWWTILTAWDYELRGPNFQAQNTPVNTELFPATSQLDSPQVFAARIQTEVPGYIDAVLPVGAILQNCVNLPRAFIQTSGSMQVSDWVAAASTFYLPSVLGLITFKSNGEIVPAPLDIFMSQFYDSQNSRLIINPVSIGSPPMYPAPTYAERTYQKIIQPVEVAFIVLNVLALLFLAVLTFLVLRYMHDPVIKSASPKMLFVFSAGILFLLIGNLCFSLDNSDDGCRATIFFVSLGFDLVIWALLLKTFRLCIIFLSQKLKVFILRDKFLFVAFILPLLLVNLFISALWSGLGGMQVALVKPFPFRPLYDYHACATSDLDTSFLWFVIALKLVYVILGVVLTCYAQELGSWWNESRALANTLFLGTLVSILTIALIASGWGDHQLEFVFFEIGLWIFCVVATSCFLLTLILAMRKSRMKGMGPDGMSIRTNMDQTSNRTHSSEKHKLTNSGEGGNNPNPNPNRVVPIQIAIRSHTPNVAQHIST